MLLANETAVIVLQRPFALQRKPKSPHWSHPKASGLRSPSKGVSRRPTLRPPRSSHPAPTRNNPLETWPLMTAAIATCTKQAVNVARINSDQAPECHLDTASHRLSLCSTRCLRQHGTCSGLLLPREPQGPGGRTCTRWGSRPRMLLLQPQLSPLSAGPLWRQFYIRHWPLLFKKKKNAWKPLQKWKAQYL